MRLSPDPHSSPPRALILWLALAASLALCGPVAQELDEALPQQPGEGPVNPEGVTPCPDGSDPETTPESGLLIVLKLANGCDSREEV